MFKVSSFLYGKKSALIRPKLKKTKSSLFRRVERQNSVRVQIWNWCAPRIGEMWKLEENRQNFPPVINKCVVLVVRFGEWQGEKAKGVGEPDARFSLLPSPRLRVSAPPGTRPFYPFIFLPSYFPSYFPTPPTVVRASIFITFISTSIFPSFVWPLFSVIFRDFSFFSTISPTGESNRRLELSGREREILWQTLLQG